MPQDVGAKRADIVAVLQALFEEACAGDKGASLVERVR